MNEYFESQWDNDELIFIEESVIEDKWSSGMNMKTLSYKVAKMKKEDINDYSIFLEFVGYFSNGLPKFRKKRGYEWVEIEYY